MRRKCFLVMVLLLSAALMSSCALLPEEESVRTAPMVRGYVRPTYETTTVERGDLIQKVKVSCNYVPVQTVSLPFALDDVYIDRYMVQAGDTVEKGQLLAQLQLGDLENRIANVENEIAVLELKTEHEKKLYDIEQRRLAITTAGMEVSEKKETLAASQESYEERMQALEDERALRQLALEKLTDDLNARQIRAPFDGTITRVAKFKDGDMSEFGVGVITLVDSTRSIFRANTEYWDRFSPGDVHEITVQKIPYEAVVASAEELGLKEQTRVEGKKSYVYFALTQPSFELEDGDVGTIEIVLDERLDVLHVPAKTVSAAGETPIVYYLREDGMKAYKTVETGVTIDGRIQILSGLEEGETIIMQ